MAITSWMSRLQRGSILVVGGVLALLGLGKPVTAGQIDITARAIKSSILVGEPLVLSVHVRADVPVVVPTDLMSPDLPFRVLIDQGAGFAPYVEYVLSPAPEAWGAGRFPDGVRRELLLGFSAAARDWTFRTPGTYRLVVEHQQPTGGPVRSNVVTVSVQAPTGAEKEVHDRLRQLGPANVVVHDSEPLGSLEALAQEHPQSVYLHERRWRDLESRIGDIASGYEPGPTRYMDPPPPQDHRPEARMARSRDQLSLALEVAEIPGQFQPDALLKLGELYYMAGEPEQGREVFERIVREFPDREAARIARGVAGDRTPPTLAANASPSTLWPPNNKLVPVAVSVTVNDDTDPNPTVKLVRSPATMPATRHRTSRARR